MFEINVLIGACIMLIVILAVIGYFLSQSNKNTKEWPPTIAVCPDYWEDTTGTGKHCKNVHSLGRCLLPADERSTSRQRPEEDKGVDLTAYATDKMRCESSKIFRDQCNVSWDGITNDDNACSTSDSKDKAAASSGMSRPMVIAIVIILIVALLYLFTGGSSNGGNSGNGNNMMNRR